MRPIARGHLRGRNPTFNTDGFGTCIEAWLMFASQASWVCLREACVGGGGGGWVQSTHASTQLYTTSSLTPSSSTSKLSYLRQVHSIAGSTPKDEVTSKCCCVCFHALFQYPSHLYYVSVCIECAICATFSACPIAPDTTGIEECGAKCWLSSALFAVRMIISRAYLGVPRSDAGWIYWISAFHPAITIEAPCTVALALYAAQGVWTLQCDALMYTGRLFDTIVLGAAVRLDHQNVPIHTHSQHVTSMFIHS